MCGGAYFQHQNEFMRMYFPNPKAVLPVLRQDGEVDLVQWGRRKEQDGELPATGWARLDSIHAGKWDRFFPQPVLLPVLAFMEKDTNKVSHWYVLQKGQYIQGMIARSKDSSEKRLYVVTVVPTPDDAVVHNRWPRVVQKGEELGVVPVAAN